MAFPGHEFPEPQYRQLISRDISFASRQDIQFLERYNYESFQEKLLEVSVKIRELENQLHLLKIYNALLIFLLLGCNQYEVNNQTRNSFKVIPGFSYQ